MQASKKCEGADCRYGLAHRPRRSLLQTAVLLQRRFAGQLVACVSDEQVRRHRLRCIAVISEIAAGDADFLCAERHLRLPHGAVQQKAAVIPRATARCLPAGPRSAIIIPSTIREDADMETCEILKTLREQHSLT